MKSYFLTGYRCNLTFFVFESLIAFTVMIWRRRMPIAAIIAFVVFVLLSFAVLYRGKKKKPLSKMVQMRLQSFAYIIVNGFLSCSFDSAQVFIYAMCFSSVVNFVFIDTKQASFQMLVSIIAALGVGCYAGFYTQSAQTMLVYTFGWLTLAVMNWVMISVTHIISYQTRQNMEQERSLDDLLKVVEAKCDEARAATRSKTRFLANMSHEIRTPINSVMGMNEMILRESTEDNIRDYASEAKTAAESLLSIINDILDITKIEEGRVTLIPVNYDITRIISDVHNLIKLRAQAKGLRFEVKADSYLPRTLEGDDIRIKQILTNLLSNAVKYTHEGFITLEVKYFGAGKIGFAVRDTGIGIKEQDIDRLFDAFKRMDETRNRSIEGTGLGLNITATMLKMMGSELKVQSTYGKGSEFSFVLKQRVVDNTAIGELDLKVKHQPQKSYTATFSAPDAKVLVVDDNDMNRKVLRQLLKSLKVDVSDAASGKACLELVRQTRFDLIFMDHMMPEMDGIETFHHLREDEDSLCADTPVVILTANAVIGAEQQYLKEGFDGFLSKPVMPEKLERMVFSMLDVDQIMPADAKADSGAPTAVQAAAEQVDLPVIDGIDWSYGRMHLNDDAALLETVKLFRTALQRDMDELDGYFADIEDETDRNSYRVKVHSMKSSAALIGIVSLAGMAMELEHAARFHECDTIKALHPVFRQRWLSYAQPLSAMFDSGEPKSDATDHTAEIDEIFAQIRAAAEEMDVDALDELSAKLDGYTFSEEQANKVEEVKASIFNFEIEKLMEAAL